MDDYCLNTLGFLLDRGPNVRTLENPDQHSVHCLVDVPACRNSGFWLLGSNPGGTTKYKSEFRLDANGNAKALELARQEGSKWYGCSTCYQTGFVGTRSGFQATIAGHLNGDQMTTLTVQPSSVSCESLLVPPSAPAASSHPTAPPSASPPPSPPPSPHPSPPPLISPPARPPSLLCPPAPPTCTLTPEQARSRCTCELLWTSSCEHPTGAAILCISAGESG